MHSSVSVHLLAQSPTASFWQAIGPVCNIQMSGKGFSHLSQDEPFGKGTCASGAAHPPWGGSGLPASLGLGDQCCWHAVDVCMQKRQPSPEPCLLGWVRTTVHKQPSWSSYACPWPCAFCPCGCPKVRAPAAWPGASTAGVLGHWLFPRGFCKLPGEIVSEFGFQGSL